MTSVTTEASLTGWEGKLEMSAVKRAQEAFHENVQNTATTIFPDNTIMVVYINRHEGTQAEAMSVGMGGVIDGQGLQHDATSVPCRRQAEQDGRCPAQGIDRPQRVGAISRNVQQDLRRP